MPHKHKRKRDGDISNFDLAPTTKAKPLAAYNKASIFSKEEDSASTKRRKPNPSRSKKSQDDTPKAFARLMAWQATGKKPSGLDEGHLTKSSKKQRKQSGPTKDSAESQRKETNPKSKPDAVPQPAELPPAPPTVKEPTLKILPGESLSTFALRVDQTLPLSSIARKNVNPSNLPADLAAKLKKSQNTTKHNKRLQRMQADWRMEETKLKEKEEEENDEREDQKEEEGLLWSSVRAAGNSRKGKKKRGTTGTGKGDGDDDPWKDLAKKRREETKQRNLQDVVKAPPTLKKVKSKFKTRDEDFDALDRNGNDVREEENVMVDVKNVPNAVGSLRRREELNATRKAVIEGYRKIQGKKRGVGERLNLSRAITT